MKNNFNLDELEEFLSDSAEQHRMYPSDKVWRNINKELHGNKSWPALTFGAILTGAVITAGLILVHPDKSLLSVNIPVQTAKTNLVTKAKANSNSTDLSGDFTLAKIENISGIIPAEALNNKQVTSSGQKIGVVKDINSPAGAKFISSSNSNTHYLAGILHVENSIGVTSVKEQEIESGLISEEQFEISAKGYQSKAGIFGALPQTTLNELNSETALQKSATSFGLPSNKKKWSKFFYITPSISYRYLTEAKVVDLHYNGPVAPNLVNGVNKFVRQSPTFGFELGGGMMYQLSKSVRLRMGLQANIRGYSIDAFSSSREPSTIVLNRGFYTDSIIAMSSISNMDGYKEIKIKNRYFELSAPISLDLQVAKIKRAEFYIAAGLQPTYQFNNGMYMVSNDYKNYVQNPDLARHFNINSAIEAYISFKKGGVTWQAGPQLRYQLLPGAVEQYPVREHLFDYGFKIGVVKTLK